MSMKTYIVKTDDTFGQIVLKAMKDNKDLSSEDIERANGHIKKFSDICVDDTIYIPSPKPKATSLYAAPTEGKCGNEFTYVPVGKKATMASVSGKLNGKSTPNLEPNQTYVLEREKIEESQQGSLEITYNGKALPLVKDMSPFKEQIGQHKDVKATLIVVDKEMLTPAKEMPMPVQKLKSDAASLDINQVDFSEKPDFQIPEATMDNDRTMTGAEFMRAQEYRMERAMSYKHFLEFFGIDVKINTSEKHSMVAVEIPPDIFLDTGVFNIDEMKDEAVEKFTQAMAIAMAPGTKEALSKLVAELFTLGMLPGLAKEKKAFWKQMGFKGKYVISIEKGKRIVQFYPTTHFTASWKVGATKAEQKKLKKGLVKYNKKYTLGHTAFDKQLKQAIPFLVKSKVGYLEKFISGLSRGGTVISIIFIGGADTAKWYFDKKSQDVDLWAIWGVAIATGVIAAAAYNATAALTATALAGTAAAGSIVLTIGIAVVASVWVAWEVAKVMNEYKIKENLIGWLRTMETEE